MSASGLPHANRKHCAMPYEVMVNISDRHMAAAMTTHLGHMNSGSIRMPLSKMPTGKNCTPLLGLAAWCGAQADGSADTAQRALQSPNCDPWPVTCRTIFAKPDRYVTRQPKSGR